jgi:hypothetical protein
MMKASIIGWFLGWLALVFSASVVVGHVGGELWHSYYKHVEDQLQYGHFYRINCIDSAAMLSISTQLSPDICENARRKWKTSPTWAALSYTVDHVLEHDIMAPVRRVYQQFFWLFVLTALLAVGVTLYSLVWLCMRGPMQMYMQAVALGAGGFMPMPGQTPNKQL